MDPRDCDVRRRIASEYLRPLFGFCLYRTATVDEAEDLLGDIVVQLYSSLRSTPSIGNLEAWLWRVATYTWRRRLARTNGSREVVGLPVDPLDHAPGPEEILLRDEQVMLLRREIAALSSTHRELIVGRYFEGHSIRALARRTGIPEGTIKWHLFEARRIVSKGVESMTQYGERSFRPETLTVGFCGQIGDTTNPSALINTRRIPQNIALACYGQPMSPAALASDLGIGRPYMEDEVVQLARSELLVGDGKEGYRTGFIIPTAGLVRERLSMQRVAALEVVPRVQDFFDRRRSFVAALGAPSGLDEYMVLWTLIPYVLSDPKILGTRPTFEGLPMRADGGRWVVMAFHRTDEHRAAYTEHPHLNCNGPMISSDMSGMAWALELDWTGFGTFREWLVRSGRLSHHVVDHLIDHGMRLDSVDQGLRERVAALIERGILESRGGLARCRVLWLGREQSAGLRALGEELRRALEPARLGSLVPRIEELYRNHVPAHLHAQISHVVAASAYDVALMAVAGLVGAGYLPRPSDTDRGRICCLLQGEHALPAGG